MIAAIFATVLLGCQVTTESAAGGHSNNSGKGNSVGKQWIDFRQGGTTRNYLLYTPSKYSSDSPAALVVVLHGGHGDGQRAADQTGFVPVADREGFLVVYPEAVEDHWNDGRRTTVSDFDDVAYITAVVEDVSARRTVDADRVFVTGISNGGMMTQRLACDATEKFAAYASVVANLPAAREAICKPTRPVSMLLINGTEDPLMPYRGGEIKKGRRAGKGGTVLSAPETAAFWASTSGCSMTGATTQLPDKDSRDGSTIKATRYGECDAGVSVRFYSIDGGGHAWPGSPVKPRFTRLTGKMSNDVAASELIWEFFADQSG
jgi:polyhydroxybutyrate depolymerase